MHLDHVRPRRRQRHVLLPVRSERRHLHPGRVEQRDPGGEASEETTRLPERQRDDVVHLSRK